ncbi:MAG: DUF4397 domain-containing protein [Pseudomonadota bacterium]
MKTPDTLRSRLRAAFAALALVAVCLAGCTDTPDAPAGQGRIRAVHAIPEFGTVAFLIEAVTLSQLTYQETGAFEQFDSLNYDFNFDTVDGVTVQTLRLASQTLTLAPDTDYTFFLTGTPDAPVVTLATLPELVEDDSATTVELWFSNLSRVADEVDLYLGEADFDPASTTPLLTVANNTFSELVTIDAGSLQLVATRAGDPADILIRTELVTLTGGDRALLNLFDSQNLDTGEFTMSISTSAATSVALVDVAAPSQVQLVHASASAGSIDLLVDASTTPAIAALSFGQTTVPTTIEEAGAEALTLFVTPAGDPGVQLVEQEVVLIDAGVNFIVLFGDQADETLALARTEVVRQPVFDAARLGIFNTVLDVDRIEFYLLREDDVLEETNPILISPAFDGSRVLTSTVISADNYRIVVTNNADDSILAGPIDLPLQAGDIRQVVLADTLDPNVVEVLVIDPLNP